MERLNTYGKSCDRQVGDLEHAVEVQPAECIHGGRKEVYMGGR